MPRKPLSKSIIGLLHIWKKTTCKKSLTWKWYLQIYSTDWQTAIPVLQVLFANRENRHIDPFIEFLKESEANIKCLNKDQWDIFYEFSRTMDDNFTGYSDTAAWPSLLDEYVEWRRHQNWLILLKPYKLMLTELVATILTMCLYFVGNLQSMTKLDRLTFSLWSIIGSRRFLRWQRCRCSIIIIGYHWHARKTIHILKLQPSTS